MAVIRWDVIFSFGVLISPVLVSADQSGFRRYYVLQPGQRGTDRVHVSSITSRSGASGQPHTYNVELTARFGGQVRTRRTGNRAVPAVPLRHDAQLTHVNVCGGQCCIGWSKAPGSQRCTKPNCLPKCQNGGMCLRPQMCVCKPGSKGTSCEQTTLPPSSHPAGVVPQRPIPQQVLPQGPIHGPLPLSGSRNPHRTLTMKANSNGAVPFQHHVQPPVSMTMHQGKSQKFVFKPKLFHTHTHGMGQTPERSIPLTAGQQILHAGNHTGRIKVVFTPTICKVSCSSGRCHNICEKGNTTTLISENGHTTDTLTAPNFRVVVCHLPCMNGGRCSARDKCQCPPNFTGKFCQMPTVVNNQGGQVHSTHTLPLTFRSGQNQGIVNIHVKHPPEASVQIHQVSESSSSNRQKIQNQGHSVLYPQAFPHYPPLTSKSQLGRCFQETTGTQCGKALPGLSKQEDCCGTVGTSWGFHKCLKCPRKPSFALFECPPGYKRFNRTRCIDVDECQLQGACPNGNCINTMGSYRCLCNHGFIPDRTLTACYPELPPVPEERAVCFRLLSTGQQCLHPVGAQLSKQLCCCSVGKAWGQHCELCPLPGTAAFKEICPGGMGYHVTTPYVYKPKLPPPLHPHRQAMPTIRHQEPTAGAPPVLLPTLQQPVEAFSFTERHLPVVPVESLASPVVSLFNDLLLIHIRTVCREVDECSVSPDICGPGFCLNTAESYSCMCYEGYVDADGSTCVDIDECEDALDLCSNGRCKNTPGSFLCECWPGFAPDEEGTSCRDVNECEAPHVCPEKSVCVNTFGSYSCHQCSAGYQLGSSAQCEDVDECQDGGVCPAGLCYNTLGSYMCSPCPEGFQGKDGQCVDIDECEDGTACAHGQCSNHEGFFVCICNEGFTPTPDRKACTDTDECQDESVCMQGHCQNTEGSFNCNCEIGFRLSSSREQCDDVDECEEGEGLCDGVGQCVNNLGSYHCNCPPGFRQINNTSCQDVDECVEAPLHLQHGECVNTDGSFDVICEPGYVWTQEPPGCEDVDECSVNSTECRGRGACHNTVGSFLCHCDPGYQDFHDGQGCVDLNECELLSDVCGEAECENVPGSFLCVCPGKDREFNRMTAKCLPVVKVPSVERKECYYNLDDENLCDNVLTRSVTIEECCCTLGAGWGDNCEVFPCPVKDTDQFVKMCPAGPGSIPSGNAVLGVSSADNADECVLFGTEICKDGFCLDTIGSYECYCKAGFYYHELQCVDTDECLDESSCVNGQCKNTRGSYQCFCAPPMELAPDGKSCSSPAVAEQIMFQSVCWETVTDTLTCTNPLSNKETTYTECCCLYGEAWGMDCALCPLRDSEDYVIMCNLRGSSSNRRPYGRDALVAAPVHEYEVSPEYDPRPMNPEPTFYEDYVNLNTPGSRYSAFEGLQAEECGVLNGCENGHCVRVQEGFTCDCFDGYTLDMSRMACVDVNECSELNKQMSLCKNAKCINTKGSYKCQCVPGYTQSDQPNYCVPIQQSTSNTASTATE
uniref:Latent transforming growth factor beta binding protein 1 n=1 Tax=Electrophorus electricus TaxID=8005 RepID=A0AAY5EAH0_ELEEL